MIADMLHIRRRVDPVAEAIDAADIARLVRWCREDRPAPEHRHVSNRVPRALRPLAEWGPGKGQRPSPSPARGTTPPVPLAH